MLSDWWNGVELWMLGLPFPFQFALVVVVLVPVCLVVARAIDRIVDHASALFSPAAAAEPPLSSVTLAETDFETETETESVQVEAVEADTMPDAVLDVVSGPEPEAEPVPAETTGRAAS
ncbi:MAG: hypothetical protein ACRDSK_08375 [Actinophytocola sp.]|uniref:hypothetical protein n=1 Tax=Actinophytocola sp. TaxID=1872138 RepID=UPI003D6B200B